MRRRFPWQRLLVVGIDTRAVASSANRLGLSVWSIDAFDDVDLRESVKELVVVSLRGEGYVGFSPPFEFVQAVRTCLLRQSFDGVLIASGFDDFPEVVAEIEELCPVLGNSAEAFRLVRDFHILSEFLRKHDFQTPKTNTVAPKRSAKEACAGLSPPYVVKPHPRAGGYGIEMALDEEELEALLQKLWANPGVKYALVQEFVEGLDCSASFLAFEGGATLLTVNEQLIGVEWLSPPSPFAYCGNVVPLEVDAEVCARVEELCRLLSKEFGLRGSNGVDFVLSSDGELYVMEVNPRFQGTLECVEQVLGVNVVELHLASISGNFLGEAPKPSRFCAKLVVYADERCVVGDLRGIDAVRDITPVGRVVEKGAPICTVIGVGGSKEEALEKAKIGLGEVRKRLKKL